MLDRACKIGVRFLYFIGAGAVAFSSIPPSEAESNLKGWLKTFGIEGIGDAWTSATDRYVIIAGSIVLLCLLGWKVRSFVWARFGKRREHPSMASLQASTAPVPTTWISRSTALAMIRKSSLIRLRVPAESITVLEALVRHWGLSNTKTPGEVRAEELQRKLLRDFESEHPCGVVDEQYGKELLEWWIEERVFGTDP